MPDLRTSEEWSQIHTDMIVYDPDGWDRKNLQFSWYEERITEEEFLQRRMRSSLLPKLAARVAALEGREGE